LNLVTCIYLFWETDYNRLGCDLPIVDLPICDLPNM
jgi:hypothetical protein